jgi:DNA-binding response OmpR family regulator
VAIVEHDDATAALVERTLTDMGWRSWRFSNGASAAGTLAGPSPSLTARVVLMDTDMPAINGYELLAVLGQDGVLEGTTVIMLSADDDPAARKRALELGAADYLAKPVDGDALQRRLAALLA